MNCPTCSAPDLFNYRSFLVCLTCGRMYVKTYEPQPDREILVEFACAKKLDFTQWPPDIELMERGEKANYDKKWLEYARQDPDDTDEVVY